MEKEITKTANTSEFCGANADVNVGLSTDEVNYRIAHNKTNAVKNKSTKSYLRIFVDNVCTFFNLLGLACFIALASVGTKHLSSYVFSVIYIANISIGIIQEVRAKRTIERLTLLKAPVSTVVRNGKKEEIPISSVVLDDVLFLSIGMQIPADCILAEGCIETDESLLTGESVPIKKLEGDDLLSGSFVVSGSCYARVSKVGEECYAQTLSKKAKQYKRTHSALLTSMTHIIKGIGFLIIPLAFLIGFEQFRLGRGDVPQIVTVTTSVIIGMIPAGMFFLMTLALAVGIIKLGQHNTLVQDMYSLESLARVDTLCLDKTGTITDGNMTVYSTYLLAENEDVNKIVASMQAALDAENQTAAALKAYFKSEELLTPKNTLAFSSMRKYSAVEFDSGVFVLGAPEFIMKDIPESISSVILSHTTNGRRTLMLAKAERIEGDAVCGDIRPICLIALEDNIRKEAIDTIKWFKENDVRVVVISGDDPLTVSKIAARAGVEDSENCVSLYGLDDDEVRKVAKDHTVFGRVSPEQKAILIKFFKDEGKTVAMTGDGVNDILAMKQADCAISVASGSAAAKSLAHIVLLDNNFDSMPKVVKEGRRVINNIQQSSSLYLMKTLFTIVIAVISIATWAPYPLSTGMMLPLEFFVIGLSSFFLSLQPNDDRVQGSFISQVLSNSVPAALILVLNTVLAMYCKVFGINVEGVGPTIIVFALVFGGWVSLLLMCIPMNNYRFNLIAAITVLIVLCMNFADVKILGRSFFDFPRLSARADWQAMVFLLVLALIDIPIFYGFDVLFKKLGLKVTLEKRISKRFKDN